MNRAAFRVVFTAPLLALLMFVSVMPAKIPVVAQTSTTPSTVTAPPALTAFDPTPIATAISQQSAWTTWAAAQIQTLGQNQSADETKLKSLTDQAAAIGTLQQQVQQLQTQLAADEARITTLENSVKSLQSKTQQAGTTLAQP